MDLRAVNPDVEDQGVELTLIAALIPELGHRSLIDVGAERGEMASVLRDAGADPIWLIEPFPGSVARLRERFADAGGVHVLDVAAGAEDGSAELHLAHDPSGESLDAFHTLHPEGSGAGLEWRGAESVGVRSLDSLRAAGEVPAHVGVLKIDTEGADAEVLRGAGSISADIVMVEFWRDLPDTLGRCPYELDELRALVEPLGPRRFLFVRHGPRHLSVERWDSADVVEREWGNLVFFADPLVSMAQAALPAIDRALADRNERITAEVEAVARERLELIERLTREADERLELIEQLSRAADERLALIRRLSRAARSDR
jgi:FkbM family methyltransferase